MDTLVKAFLLMTLLLLSGIGLIVDFTVLFTQYLGQSIKGGLATTFTAITHRRNGRFSLARTLFGYGMGYLVSLSVLSSLGIPLSEVGLNAMPLAFVVGVVINLPIMAVQVMEEIYATL